MKFPRNFFTSGVQKNPNARQGDKIPFPGWKILVGAMAFLTACSPPPETPNPETAPADSSAIEAEAVPAQVEKPKESTTEDQLPPAEVDKNTEAMEASGSDAAILNPETEKVNETPSNPKPYWYADIPETKAEQIELKVTLKKQVREMEREISLFSENLIQNDPELAAMRKQLEGLREQERELVLQSPEIAELDRIQQERKTRYEEMGNELGAMKAALEAKGEFTPEKWMLDQHPKQKGCCGLHYPDEADLDTPGQRYLAKVGERRQLLMKIAGYGREKAETIYSLSESNPEIQSMREEEESLTASLKEKVERNPGYLQMQKDLNHLRNKELYLGRLILEDPLYTNNVPSPSERP